MYVYGCLCEDQFVVDLESEEIWGKLLFDTPQRFRLGFKLQV